MDKMLKQKIMAVIILILAIVSIFVEMDGTVALFLIPFAVGLFISKKCWLAE